MAPKANAQNLYHQSIVPNGHTNGLPSGGQPMREVSVPVFENDHSIRSLNKSNHSINNRGIYGTQSSPQSDYHYPNATTYTTKQSDSPRTNFGLRAPTRSKSNDPYPPELKPVQSIRREGRSHLSGNSIRYGGTNPLLRYSSPVSAVVTRTSRRSAPSLEAEIGAPNEQLKHQVITKQTNSSWSQPDPRKSYSTPVRYVKVIRNPLVRTRVGNYHSAMSVRYGTSSAGDAEVALKRAEYSLVNGSSRKNEDGDETNDDDSSRDAKMIQMGSKPTSEQPSIKYSLLHHMSKPKVSEPGLIALVRYVPLPIALMKGNPHELQYTLAKGKQTGGKIFVGRLTSAGPPQPAHQTAQQALDSNLIESLEASTPASVYLVPTVGPRAVSNATSSNDTSSDAANDPIDAEHTQLYSAGAIMLKPAAAGSTQVLAQMSSGSDPNNNNHLANEMTQPTAIATFEMSPTIATAGMQPVRLAYLPTLASVGSQQQVAQFNGQSPNMVPGGLSVGASRAALSAYASRLMSLLRPSHLLSSIGVNGPQPQAVQQQQYGYAVQSPIHPSQSAPAQIYLLAPADTVASFSSQPPSKQQQQSQQMTPSAHSQSPSMKLEEFMLDQATKAVHAAVSSAKSASAASPQPYYMAPVPVVPAASSWLQAMSAQRPMQMMPSMSSMQMATSTPAAGLICMPSAIESPPTSSSTLSTQASIRSPFNSHSGWHNQVPVQQPVQQQSIDSSDLNSFDYYTSNETPVGGGKTSATGKQYETKGARKQTYHTSQTYEQDTVTESKRESPTRVGYRLTGKAAAGAKGKTASRPKLSYSSSSSTSFDDASQMEQQKMISLSTESNQQAVLANDDDQPQAQLTTGSRYAGGSDNSGSSGGNYRGTHYYYTNRTAYKATTPTSSTMIPFTIKDKIDLPTANGRRAPQRPLSGESAGAGGSNAPVQYDEPATDLAQYSSGEPMLMTTSGPAQERPGRTSFRSSSYANKPDNSPNDDEPRSSIDYLKASYLHESGGDSMPLLMASSARRSKAPPTTTSTTPPSTTTSETPSFLRPSVVFGSGRPDSSGINGDGQSGKMLLLSSASLDPAAPAPVHSYPRESSDPGSRQHRLRSGSSNEGQRRRSQKSRAEAYSSGGSSTSGGGPSINELVVDSSAASEEVAAVFHGSRAGVQEPGAATSTTTTVPVTSEAAENDSVAVTEVAQALTPSDHKNGNGENSIGVGNSAEPEQSRHRQTDSDVITLSGPAGRTAASELAAATGSGRSGDAKLLGQKAIAGADNGSPGGEDASVSGGGHLNRDDDDDRRRHRANGGGGKDSAEKNSTSVGAYSYDSSLAAPHSAGGHLGHLDSDNEFARISDALQTNPIDLIDLQNARSSFELPAQLESFSSLP